MEMHAERLAELLVMLLVPVGAGNDLLDCISTADYWSTRGVEVSVEAMQAELRVGEVRDVSALIEQMGSDDFSVRERASRQIRAMGPLVIPQLEKAAESQDPEIAFRAQMLMRQLGHGKMTKRTRQLMAIRTLGELQDRNALPTLRGYLESDEVFVADYAGRAIARIEGKPAGYVRLSPEELDKEVWLLPGGTATVAQFCVQRRVPCQLDEMLRRIRGLGGDFGGEGFERKVAESRQGLHALIDRVGNVRVEAATLAVAGNIGPREGFVVFMVRGRYDKDRMLALFSEFGVEASKVEGVDAIVPDDEICFLFPSNDRFVFLAGVDGKSLPTKELIAALKGGQGKVGENAELKRLIESVDRTKMVWMAMHVSPAYKKAPVLSALDSMTAVIQQKEDGLTGAIVGHGGSEGELAAAVMIIDLGLKEVIREASEEIDDMPALKPLVEMLKTIKHERKGTTVTVTGELKGDGTDLLTPLLFPFIMFGGPF